MNIRKPETHVLGGIMIKKPSSVMEFKRESQIEYSLSKMLRTTSALNF